MGRDSKRSKKYRADDWRQDCFRKGRQPPRGDRKECAACPDGVWDKKAGKWTCRREGDCLYSDRYEF